MEKSFLFGKAQRRLQAWRLGVTGTFTHRILSQRFLNSSNPIAGRTTSLIIPQDRFASWECWQSFIWIKFIPVCLILGTKVVWGGFSKRAISIRTKKHLLRFSNQKKLALHTRLLWIIILCCVETSLSLDPGSTGFTLLTCQERTELKLGALASLPAGSTYIHIVCGESPSPPASISSFVKGGGEIYVSSWLGPFSSDVSLVQET